MDFKPYLIEISLTHDHTDNADTYPFDIPAVANLGRLTFHPDVTFIIATHSPILLAYPNAKIIQLDNSGLSEVDYEQTEHYQITRDFLNKYEQMVDILTSE